MRVLVTVFSSNLSVSDFQPPLNSTSSSKPNMVIVNQMLQIKPVTNPMVNHELRLASTRMLRFAAPQTVEIGGVDEQLSFRKRSNSNQFNDVNDAWVGVEEFCQAIDDILVIEKDTELFLGKSVLEIGFTTAIPSILAMDSGANEITMHSWNPQSLATYVKATVRRNAIPKNLCKFTTGELESCLASLKGKKFDIILCPELIGVNEENFQLIHDILNSALGDHGLILLSGRSFYDTVSGSVQGFLDLVKQNGVFDAFVRWTSTKSEVNPRKLVQMTCR